MTTPWRTRANAFDPAQDVDRLGDAWDALVAGRQPSIDGPEAELLAITGQLSAEATQIRPTLTFRNSLRETLMHTTPTTAALPAPTFHPLPKLGRPVEIGSPIQKSVTSIPSRIQRAGMRWAAVAATIALLLATAAGGFLASRGPGEGRSTRVSGFAASPEASPFAVSSYVDPCRRDHPYFPCGADPLVGSAYIAGYLYSPATTDVSLVTMRGWELPAGETITFEPDPDHLVGIGVDVVLEGAYVATFSGPVVVSRPAFEGGVSVTYPSAGELVELGQGDSVSFELGSRVDTRNPLSTVPLRFKSIAIHAEPRVDTGAPGEAQPIEGNPVGGLVVITDDGTGQLPKPIGDYPNRGEVRIVLTYSQIDPTAPFPPEMYRGEVILGPVDPLQEGIEEGYIVWAFELSG